MSTEQSKRWWWLGWSWRVACATYLVGFLFFLPYQLIMIFWSVFTFTPLVAATLYMTRAPQLAKFAVPVVLSALYAAGHLVYAGVNGQGVPRSTLYLAFWTIGALGPFALFFLVTRYLKGRQEGQAETA